MYVGDFRLGDTLDVKFTTVNTSGVPTTLAGTPVVSAYPGNSTTQLTAGITLTVDFDTVTGLHNVRVVATGANGYATATNYALVITTGTVGGSSVVGYVIGHFSIEARSALMPTTAARTIDVTATGAAGIDLGNAENQGSTLALTGTTVATVTTTTTATNLTNLPAITSNWLTAAGIAAGALDGKGNWNIGKTGYSLTATTGLGNQTADITGSLSGSVGSVTGAVGSVTGAVGSVTGAVGSVTGNVGGNVTGSVGSLATQAKADVNAEVVDALNVDTYAEPGQGTPAATLSLAGKVGFIYKAWRNRMTQTSTTYSLYADDAVTVDHKATVSDDGTTFDRTEIATGP